MKKIVSDHLSDVIAPRILEAMDQNQLPEMLNLAWSDYTTAMARFYYFLNLRFSDNDSRHIELC